MKRIGGKSYSDIAKDIAPHLGKDHSLVRVYVFKWLNAKSMPSRDALIAIKKAGYPIEPFIFGKDWKENK